MNSNQKIRDAQGVSRIFLAVLPLGEETRSGGGIEAVTVYRGEGAKDQSKCERKMESGHPGLADIRFAPVAQIS